MEVAVAYIRVSGLRQVKEGNSLKTQDDLVRDYCVRRGYRLERVFREEGETAKTSDRPVLHELLVLLKKNRTITVLVIPKIDRLTRSTIDYITLKAQFQRLDVRIESVGENLQESPTGRLMESLLASVAQFDNEIRAERSKGGMVTAISEGRYIWRAPPGFRAAKVNNRRTLEQDSTTAPLMRDGFEQIARGHRERDVRQWLAENGLRLCRSTFYRHLRNKVYMGVVEHYGISVSAQLPLLPIVSESTFFQVQAAITKKAMPLGYQRDNPGFPLRGHLYCVCGKKLTACWSQGRHRCYAYYRCMYCKRVNLSRELVEKRFVKLLENESDRLVGLIAKLEPVIENEWKATLSKRTKDEHVLTRDLTSLRELQKALAIKNAQGIIPDTLAGQQIAEIETKIHGIAANLAEAQSPTATADAVINFAKDFLANLVYLWRVAEIAEQKRLLAFLYPNGLKITVNRAIRTAKKAGLNRENGTKPYKVSSTVGSLTLTPNPGASRPRCLKCSKGSKVLPYLLELHEHFSNRKA